MMKKGIVVLIIALLCSEVTKANDLSEDLPNLLQKDTSSNVSDTPKSLEDSLAELLTSAEKRAQAVKVVLYAEMGDRAVATSAQLAQAQSFGAPEFLTVQDAIAKYGNSGDRSAAVDKMILVLEGTANDLHNKIVMHSGKDRIALEGTLANLTKVRLGLISAKNDIVSGVAKGMLLNLNESRGQGILAAIVTGAFTAGALVAWRLTKAAVNVVADGAAA